VKAKPVQYVKICSLYGDGFYYSPGTDTCIKLGGYVRVQGEYNAGAGGNAIGTIAVEDGQARFTRDLTNDYNYRVRGMMSWDVRQQTEYGALRTYIAGAESTPNNTGAASRSGPRVSGSPDHGGQVASLIGIFGYSGPTPTTARERDTDATSQICGPTRRLRQGFRRSRWKTPPGHKAGSDAASSPPMAPCHRQCVLNNGGAAAPRPSASRTRRIPACGSTGLGLRRRQRRVARRQRRGAARPTRSAMVIPHRPPSWTWAAAAGPVPPARADSAGVSTACVGAPTSWGQHNQQPDFTMPAPA
jgi:hypothetical protein